MQLAETCQAQPEPPNTQCFAPKHTVLLRLLGIGFSASGLALQGFLSWRA